MSANQDYKELFRILNEEKVEYIIVGAHAVIFYAEPRYTKDIDIWVNPDYENAKKLYIALSKYGAPLRDITIEDFTNPDIVYQIGIEPNRIDILIGLEKINFQDSYKNSIKTTYDGETIYILSKSDLIITKKATGRKSDLLDVERLEDI